MSQTLASLLVHLIFSTKNRGSRGVGATLTGSGLLVLRSGGGAALAPGY